VEMSTTGAASRSRIGDLRRALGSPRQAYRFLRRWSVLALHANRPLAELLAYRRELLDDAGFQAHHLRCMGEVSYSCTEVVELYALVRATRPGVIVETGVASGFSSFHLLRAIQFNRHGTLHSIDLPNVQEGSILPQDRETGWIVPASLRASWDLHLGDARKLLPELLLELGTVDLFLHDSDHSYAHMAWEFELAYARLKPGGLLLSDDTHLHTAWDDFCARHRLRATRIGHLGVTHKPGAAHANS
jgi:predicted O-methyltransferase YrrM